MSDGPEWFAQRRFGFGAGLPISWQGWALTLGFVGVMVGAGIRFGDQPRVFVAILVPLSIIYIAITMRTTRGGWHWHWGKDD